MPADPLTEAQREAVDAARKRAEPWSSTWAERDLLAIIDDLCSRWPEDPTEENEP